MNERSLTRIPKYAAIAAIVAGVVMIIAGMVTWSLVQRELEDEHITVSDDADAFAGDKVDGLLTAYTQAMTIKEHALEASGGKTYAELEQGDPVRQTVMNGSFLRASLFTSVVSFGVAALVMGLGLLFIILGVALLGLDRNVMRLAAPDLVTPGAPANADPAVAPRVAPTTT